MALYLNRKQREYFLFTLSLQEMARQWVEDKEAEMTKEMRTTVKRACTSIKNVCTKYINQLEVEDRKRLITEAKNSELYITPTRVTANRDERKVYTEDLFTMADTAIWTCQSSEPFGCRRKDFKGCALYKSMRAMNIPPARTKAKGCPYRLED